jgi:hypothetical protein
MSRNRIRKNNDLPARKMGKFVGLIVTVTIFALVFVFLQVRVYKMADEVKRLENRLAEVKEKNHLLLGQVEYRKSPRVLQNQIAYLNLNLVGIHQLDQVEAPPLNPDQMPAYRQIGSRTAVARGGDDSGRGGTP